MIPFVRNLAEYCGREKEESKLTSLLHIKEDTNSIKIKELYDLIYSVLNITDATEIDAPAMSVKDMIYLEADKLSKENFTMIELEKKIALSIAIRLKTEDFLIKKINDSELLKTIKGNQTARLYKEFKKKFSNDTAEINAIKLVERVNLMTPENIHLNSFMYEPILDLSNDHLKQLYLEVSTLDS
jgi:hypothetical protein